MPIVWLQQAREAVRELERLSSTCPGILIKRNEDAGFLANSFREVCRNWNAHLNSIERGGNVPIEAVPDMSLLFSRKGGSDVNESA